MSEGKQIKTGNWIENEENHKLLVEMWGDYINWKKRREKEKGWLGNQLKKINCKKILDSCVGDGCDAIFLKKQGFDVTGNDVDKIFIRKALQNAKKENIRLKIYNLDWRELDKKIPEQSFDAVLCTGNSLYCLFGRENKIKALKQFYKILRDGGILIIDERNYQYVLDNREKILKQKSHSRGCMYYGKNTYAKIIKIKNDRIKYEVYGKKNKKAAFTISQPFKKGELNKNLMKVGFRKIKQYSDYQSGKKPKAIFYMYVCQK